MAISKSEQAALKRWTVLRADASGAGPGLDWYDRRDCANEAALGFASRNPGKRYVILEVVGTVLSPVPALDVDEV